MSVIIPIVNIKFYLPSVFRTIKLILMALCCDAMVVDNMLSVKVICALVYVLLCHIDIIVNWGVNEDDWKDV